MSFLGNYTDDEIIVPAVVTEDIFHYAVHEGLAFDTSVYAASGDLFICFTTPNTENYCHLLWQINAENNARLDIYEGVTPGVGGSDQVVYNANRASVYGDATSAVLAGNSGTVGNVQVGIDWTLGTQINPGGYFAGKGAGVVAASHEKVLEKNTTYGFHLVDIGGKDLGLTLNWFEVPAA